MRRLNSDHDVQGERRRFSFSSLDRVRSRFGKGAERAGGRAPERVTPDLGVPGRAAIGRC